jgi:hypothetical protein
MTRQRSTLLSPALQSRTQCSRSARAPSRYDANGELREYERFRPKSTLSNEPIAFSDQAYCHLTKRLNGAARDRLPLVEPCAFAAHPKVLEVHATALPIVSMPPHADDRFRVQHLLVHRDTSLRR